MRKFLQLKGQLPPQVQKMWGDASSHASGKRARETEIVNNLFNKENGKLVLKLDSPWYTKEIDQVKTKFGEDSSAGIPRSVMVEKFRDGEAGLDRAIEAGGVQEWTVDGVVYCAIRTIKTGARQDAKDKGKLIVGKDVTPEQAKKFHLSKKEQRHVAVSYEAPDKAIDKLSQAICILEKLLAD
eukprot:6467832-Pyramimonas_sp.AAC.1